MMVNAVCHESGANLFNLTPSNTDGKYTGKMAYNMVHTTFKVAKALAPSVIWIDDIESVFKSGKVKGATGEPPNRIAKHLTAVLTPKKGSGLLEPEDRVLIIGTSSKPYDVEKPKDKEAFKDFFGKKLYAPLPNYASRQILWVQSAPARPRTRTHARARTPARPRTHARARTPAHARRARSSRTPSPPPLSSLPSSLPLLSSLPSSLPPLSSPLLPPSRRSTAA